jgi:hypothetical protein
MRHATLPSSAAFVALVLVACAIEGKPAVAVWLLGFWHYYLYALAYCIGTVPMAVFKRDAVATKTIALLALGWAYFSFPLDALSLAIIAAGFALNAIAARTLGPDRTYYGHEVAGMPPLRVTAFPYSWIPHPMLVGNMAAFGGTLLNPGFREAWWPLACTHVALNAGLLAMETTVKPRRLENVPAWTRSIAAGAVSATAGALAGGGVGAATGHTALGAALGFGALLNAFVAFRSYSSPTIRAEREAR